MSIVYKVGDVLENIKAPAILVHVCNDCSPGKWGKGFVTALSRKWKAPEFAYRKWSASGNILYKLGAVQYVEVEKDIYVANLIGQHDIYSKGNVPPIRYDAIRDGLRNVRNEILKLGLNWKVVMPRIGCGLAGARWEIIEKIIEEELVGAGAGVSVEVYTLESEVSKFLKL